jgi:uncharacterized protein (DUF433 family)
MPAMTTAYEHLSFNDEGDPIFAETRFKALHLIREHVAYGWSAEELAMNHPQLSLGQVYAALAWYADHRAQVEEWLNAEVARAVAEHARPENRRLARLLKRREL